MNDDTYKVHSDNQTGGVTAGQINIHLGEHAISALAGLKRIGEWLKTLSESGTDVPDDIRELVLRLREDLTDIRAGLADAADVNLGLQRRIDEMQELLDARANLAYRDGMYWEPGEIHASVVGHETNIGPYCPRCFDADGVKMTLQKTAYTWNCPQRGCGFTYQHSDLPEINYRSVYDT
ncbi:MAG: hypothetical protein QNI98_09005 [Woeseiaceae bacterium]|nr:hypothetical protein [Woeseiaceae bacterium]